VIAAQRIQTYVPPMDSEDEAAADHARSMAAIMPFSIIGSVDDVTTPDGRVVKGREYLWGVAEGEFGILASWSQQSLEWLCWCLRSILCLRSGACWNLAVASTFPALHSVPTRRSAPPDRF